MHDSQTQIIALASQVCLEHSYIEMCLWHRQSLSLSHLKSFVASSHFLFSVLFSRVILLNSYLYPLSVMARLLLSVQMHANLHMNVYQWRVRCYIRSGCSRPDITWGSECLFTHKRVSCISQSKGWEKREVFFRPQESQAISQEKKKRDSLRILCVTKSSIITMCWVKLFAWSNAFKIILIKVWLVWNTCLMSRGRETKLQVEASCSIKCNSWFHYTFTTFFVLTKTKTSAWFPLGNGSCDVSRPSNNVIVL